MATYASALSSPVVALMQTVEQHLHWNAIERPDQNVFTVKLCGFSV